MWPAGAPRGRDPPGPPSQGGRRGRERRRRGCWALRPGGRGPPGGRRPGGRGVRATDVVLGGAHASGDAAALATRRLQHLRSARTVRRGRLSPGAHAAVGGSAAGRTLRRVRAMVPGARHPLRRSATRRPPGAPRIRVRPASGRRGGAAGGPRGRRRRHRTLRPPAGSVLRHAPGAGVAQLRSCRSDVFRRPAGHCPRCWTERAGDVSAPQRGGRRCRARRARPRHPVARWPQLAPPAGAGVTGVVCAA